MTSYALFAPDGDLYYYEGVDSNQICSNCGSFIGEEEYFPINLTKRRLKHDISFTYDGKLLLSKKAKKFFEDSSPSSLVFKKINKSPEVFVMIVEEKVLFDVEKAETRFEDMCKKCGCYESVIGATPPFLKNHKAIMQNGVYVTDIKFGSGIEKSPLYILGEELAIKLKNEFREVDLKEVKS